MIVRCRVVVCSRGGRTVRRLSWFIQWQPALTAADITMLAAGCQSNGTESGNAAASATAAGQSAADVEIPLTTVFAGTQVVDVHPYAGDRVCVSMLSTVSSTTTTCREVRNGRDT